jgi:hypothetical protein
MSEKIINFRSAKKAVKRSAKERLAESNRAKFGRTKAQKQKDLLNAQKADAHLNGHKRED